MYRGLKYNNSGCIDMTAYQAIMNIDRENKLKNLQTMKTGDMTMLEKYKDVLTVKDLYEILPIGKNKLYTLLNENIIKNIRIGNKFLIPKKNLIEYLQQG